MIGIVVVHFGRTDRTEACLSALEQSTWPAEARRTVVVDNGDDAAFGRRIGVAHPSVFVVRSASNVGFGAACNRGIDALGDVEHVALLNNDAVPEAGWLEPLVDAMRNTGAGAVTPKVLLSDRAVSIRLRVEPLPSPPGDWRELGLQLSGARLGAVDVSSSVRLVAGFWGWEHDAVTIGGRFAWSRAAAIAQVPVAEDQVGEELALRLSSPAGTAAVSLATEGREVQHEIGPAPRWFDVGVVTGASDVLNNAGTILLPDGSSRDRGFLEPDRGQFDAPEAVFGWSGAAVLLSKAMLDDVGGFDERLFLFYEDTDLSLRGRLRGWTYRYEPTSVVRHSHAGSVGEDAPFSRHLTSRNRALVLAKVGPRAVAVAAVVGQLQVVRTALAHDVIGRMRRGHRPTVRHLCDEGRVLIGIMRRLPGSLRRRRSVLRRATVLPEELWREAEPTPTPLRADAQQLPRFVVESGSHARSPRADPRRRR